jgi:hypothetical protein
MTWIKLDDQFTDHPKVVQAGPLAGWLHVCGLVYCGRYLTDGFVPTGMIRRLADFTGIGIETGGVPGQFSVGHDIENEELVVRLLDCHMWEEVEGGYVIHDYLEYNPSKAEILAEREERSEAGRRGGLASAAGRAQAKAQANTKQELEQNASQAQAKSNPVPVPVPVPVPLKDPTTTTAADPEPASEKVNGETAALYTLIEKSGVIVASALQAQEWDNLLDITKDMGLIGEAFQDCAAQRKLPSPKYIRAILERCLADGARPGVKHRNDGPSPPRGKTSTEMLDDWYEAEKRKEAARGAR